jgi:endonuclease YncB( thermonuclease family)
MQRIITILLLVLACTVNAETITGRVVGVADGDTITVLDADNVQHKIRLAGIDAPEKKQAFGNSSKESLSDLAFDKMVDVETSKRDRYGRQIGKVLVDGRDVNLVQVERGMSWFYRQYQREQSPNDRRLYEAAEDAAKAGKRGLWRDVDPVAPWEFRRNKP